MSDKKGNVSNMLGRIFILFGVLLILGGAGLYLYARNTYYKVQLTGLCIPLILIGVAICLIGIIVFVSKSKKKWVSIVVIGVFLILLMPIQTRYKDGGTIKYRALLYSVTDYRILGITPKGYFTREVKILGIPVYNQMKQDDEYYKRFSY